LKNIDASHSAFAGGGALYINAGATQWVNVDGLTDVQTSAETSRAVYVVGGNLRLKNATISDLYAGGQVVDDAGGRMELDGVSIAATGTSYAVIVNGTSSVGFVRNTVVTTADYGISVNASGASVTVGLGNDLSGATYPLGIFAGTMQVEQASGITPVVTTGGNTNLVLSQLQVLDIET